MLSLFLLLLATNGFCQSEQEINYILQFKARSGSLVANGFSELENALAEAPDCHATREQVKAFLLDRFPVPASCVKAKKLQQKYLEVVEFLEGDCELQIHNLQLVLGNPTECKTIYENRLTSTEISEQFDGFIQEKLKSSFNCPADSADCVDECDVYATIFLQAMVKTNNISKTMNTTMETSLNFVCEADRNSNCVDALAAVSKNCPQKIADPERLLSKCVWMNLRMGRLP